MQKQQVIGLFVLLAATAAVIGAAQLLPPEQAETVPEAEDAYEALLANTPVAELEGETVSPQWPL